MYIGPSGITKVEDKKGRRPACPFMCFDCSDKSISFTVYPKMIVYGIGAVAVSCVAFSKGARFTVSVPAEA